MLSLNKTNTTIMSEVNYWSEFYAKKSEIVPESPSSFAKLCGEWISRDNAVAVEETKLVDLGCGTARDSRYFASLGINVIGVDQAQSTIDKNNQKRGPKETYILGDFCHIVDKGCSQLDFLYSRFSIHSVSKQDASDLFKWAAAQMKVGGKFFIEARSIKDPLFAKGTPDPAGNPDASICGHYRRFIRLDQLIEELEILGFSVLYQSESDGLSVCGDDNPVLIRLICEKKC